MEENNFAERLWILYIEIYIFTNKQYEQLKSDLRFMFVDEIILCKGRIENIALSYESKHPVFIPKCYFAK